MTSLDDPVLAGGGELGAMMRALDWDATPLGPPSQWPQALKTCVRIMLTSPQPIWIGWGEELTYLYNDAYKAIIGGKHPDALGKPTSVVWPELMSVIGPMLSVAMRGDEGTYVEAQRLIMERYGYEEETYYTFSYSPVRNERGGAGGIICFNTDDTRRVIGERQMALLKELAARTADARTVQDACSLSAAALATERLDVPFALIYLLDPHEDAAVLTAATASMDESVIWPLGDVIRQHEPRIVELDASFGALPTGGWERPPSRAVVLPITGSGINGCAGLLVVGLNPFRLFDDSYAGFLGLVSGQISASVRNARAYQEERERAEALAALDRAKTQFFSNVSHEFRTPLTLLLGPTEEALAEPELLPADRERLAAIHRNALRLLKLVNTLLDFSRIEAGRVQARFAPTDLPTYTAELASNFRSAIDRAGLALVVETAQLDAPVYVDRGMWETIVLNLLSNAFKHTFDGTITVSTAERDGHAVLEVRDTGVGIVAEELPHIFERFHRVTNTKSRTHEGSGIGLAFVQELVKLHGGTIQAESTPGIGTTLRVTVPLGAAHLPAEHITTGDDSRTATYAAAYVEEALRWLPGDGSVTRPTVRSAISRDATNARILVADDNADMREYVTRLLNERGWTVEAVENGEAALKAIRERRPDVILSDVMMPGLDGFALLRAMRADARTRGLPIILLSARAGEEARVEGLRAGADDYLVKPFASQELLARVAAQLDRAREAAAAEAERARLRDLFAQAPAAIAVLTGPEHVFEIANDPYLEFVGQRDILGKPIREAMPELEGQGIFDLLAQVYRTGEPFSSPEMGVMLDNRGDGVLEERFFNFTYQPLRHGDGTVSGVFVHAIDITDQVRLRHDAEGARDEAQRAQRDAIVANAAKSDFLAAMSHELRTPLNAIAGYLQLLDMGIHGPVSDAQRLVLARAERSQAHLLSLINDVLHFAKLEAGRVEYHLENCSVVEVVAQVMPMIEPQLAAKGIAHAVHIAADMFVRADADKVQQILLNLLSNAAKFTSAGGRVTISGSQRADVVQIAVTDTGCGIATDKLELIFDPFVQVHRKLTNTPEGTGLGLAISRDLAHGMGADLTVSSVEGEGSTFTLTLPALGLLD